MLFVAFFSLASLTLSALASPLAHNSPHVPDDVDQKVDGGSKAVDDTVPSVPHVRRHDTVDHITVFIAEFEVPLAKVESIVNEAPDAGALAVAIRPALGLLLAPMMKLVGHVVGQTGVSVQGTTVTVSSQQVILTVNGFATRLTSCLGKASDMVGEGFPEIKMTIQAVTSMFSAVVYSIGTISGFTIYLLSPVLKTLVPLVTKLGVCAASSLSL